VVAVVVVNLDVAPLVVMMYLYTAPEHCQPTLLGTVYVPPLMVLLLLELPPLLELLLQLQ